MAPKIEELPALEQRVRMIMEPTGGGKPVHIPVKVVGLGDDGEVSLRAVAHPEGVEFAVGTAVTLEYVRNNAVFRLQSELGKLDPSDQGGSILVLAPPSEFKKIQRRGNTRLYVAMPIQFQLVGSAMPDGSFRELPPEGRPTFGGHVAQVGPGGIGLLTDIVFKDGDVIETSLTLGDETAQLRGRIVWTGGPERLGNAGVANFSHAVGVQFMDMDPDTQATVDDYLIMELERRQKPIE